MNKKIILIIICILSITILVFTVVKTYALFESRANGQVSSKIATWKIEVNDTDITKLSQANKTFNLGQISWSSANHVKPGKGAPGSIGTINIDIVPTDTEVSFTYEISFDLSNLQNEEFQIYQISETSGDTIIRTGENSYTGIAYLNDINSDKEYEIEVQFIWNNSIENDEADYNLGSRTNENIEIPITIRVKQYTGETIEAYQENNEEDNNEESG